jgi:hypothetical protein
MREGFTHVPRGPVKGCEPSLCLGSTSPDADW